MQKKNPLTRLVSGMPLLVTVAVHVVLALVAGAIVVQQNFAEKKKTFEASAAIENPVKQVEHRLQVARRSGAASSPTSAVAANRILSTAPAALAMPEMPDLPVSGAGTFGGFGGMGSGIGMGSGTGISTSLGGGTSLGGRGFMSLSFLGMTNQRVSKVFFVVDTSIEIMEPRKGGFQAFTIIREEIMRLIGNLPPQAQFNVALFRFDSIAEVNEVELNLFRSELADATTASKEAFFKWMSPVNTRLNNYGPFTAGGRTAWTPRPLPANVDPGFLPPVWSRAVRAALEQQPDTIYVITANQGASRRLVDEAAFERRTQQYERDRENFNRAMERLGLEGPAVVAARDAAFGKAQAELEAINRRLVAEGKDPVVIGWIGALERSDVQRELARHNITLRFDGTGWTDRQGRRIDVPFFLGPARSEERPWNDFISYYARLQNALSPTRPNLNVFLFVGPDENPEDAQRNLTNVARRNGGSFQLLTAKRLEELKARAEAESTRQ